MPERDAARAADFLDLLCGALAGLLAVPTLEGLFARMEAVR